MKGRGWLAGLLVLGAIIALVVYRADHRASPPERRSSEPTLSDEEKDDIRAFWAACRRAKELKLKGSWQPAVDEYLRALEYDPRHEDSLHNLANCYFELNQFEEALESLRRLVDIDPQSHRGHFQMGIIQACPLAGHVFDLTAAENALRKAYEINQEESGSLLRLGELELARGNDERAFELLTLANQSNFRAVEGYYLRAFMRWKQQRLDDSRELLAQALRQSRKPRVVAGVPGEGDTRPGSLLPPTTVDEKRLIKPFWSTLADRYSERELETSDLQVEFAPLETYLRDLRVRIEARKPR